MRLRQGSPPCHGKLPAEKRLRRPQSPAPAAQATQVFGAARRCPWRYNCCACHVALEDEAMPVTATNVSLSRSERLLRVAQSFIEPGASPRSRPRSVSPSHDALGGTGRRSGGGLTLAQDQLRGKRARRHRASLLHGLLPTHDPRFGVAGGDVDSRQLHDCTTMTPADFQLHAEELVQDGRPANCRSLAPRRRTETGSPSSQRRRSSAGWG